MADVQKWFADVITVLRELGIRKPGELLDHLGGPEGVMETLTSEVPLRIKILDGAVTPATVANPKFRLSSAANALEVAIATEDILPGRIEEVLTPAEQARICSQEANWTYVWLGKWVGRDKAAEPVKALAEMIRAAVTHRLASHDAVYGPVRPMLGKHLPREHFQRIIDIAEKELITNELLYQLLDLEEVVRCLPRSEVARLLYAIAEENGIKSKRKKDGKDPPPPGSDSGVSELAALDVRMTIDDGEAELILEEGGAPGDTGSGQLLSPADDDDVDDMPTGMPPKGAAAPPEIPPTAPPPKIDDD